MDMLGGLSTWHLVIIVIGSVIFLFILLILSYCCKSSSKHTEKDRKRYVYKYDPFTGKGNVAVIMEMSTSNGGMITVEQPEHTSKTIMDTIDVPVKKDLCIERPRSQSFTETRYVYRYNPASGEGSVEQIPAFDMLAPKQPKSSRSHNCLMVEMLENQLNRKMDREKDLPANVLRKLSRIGSDPKGIHRVGRGSKGEKGTWHDGKQHKSGVEPKTMKTRAGKKNKGIHHVLLSTETPKPQCAGTVSDCSDSSSPPATEISRSTSELLKLQFEQNADDARVNGGRKRKNSNRSRASVGEIFPPSTRTRRKSNSRLGLLLNNHHSRASESHIFNPRRKQSEDDCTYRTLSLTSLTQTMWQREYETTAHESEAFITEEKEVGAEEPIAEDAASPPITRAHVHLVVPPVRVPDNTVSTIPLTIASDHTLVPAHQRPPKPLQDPPSYNYLYG